MATTRSCRRSSAKIDPTLAATDVFPTPPLPSTPTLWLPCRTVRMAASYWASSRCAADGPGLTRPKVINSTRRRQPRSARSDGRVRAGGAKAASDHAPGGGGSPGAGCGRADSWRAQWARADGCGWYGAAAAGRVPRKRGKGRGLAAVAARWAGDRAGVRPGRRAGRAADGPAGIRRARSWAPSGVESQTSIGHTAAWPLTRTAQTLCPSGRARRQT